MFRVSCLLFRDPCFVLTVQEICGVWLRKSASRERRFVIQELGFKRDESWDSVLWVQKRGGLGFRMSTSSERRFGVQVFGFRKGRPLLTLAPHPRLASS